MPPAEDALFPCASVSPEIVAFTPFATLKMVLAVLPLMVKLDGPGPGRVDHQRQFREHRL